MGWRIAVDRGGTFADVVARAPDGTLHVRKLLARDLPEREALAALLPQGATLDELRVGTTVATNALLTGTGAAAGLLVTEGFEDLLLIGHQARSDLFDLAPCRPEPLSERVAAIAGRLRADGGQEAPLDEANVRALLRRWREAGLESVAIALLHSWRNPAHERAVGRWAQEAGFTTVSLSHRLVPRPGLVERAGTAEADAALTPVLRRYLGAVDAVVPAGSRLLAMQSAGGLCAAADLRGVHSILSGPAGGVVACGAIARERGIPQVLGFDMGGTSTDVCRWAGDTERVDRVEVGARSFGVPALDVVTVAAGGGSCLRRDDGRLQVGPGSAGAAPGPASYGLGGPATITDANAVLGRVQPDLFPAAFGPDRDQPLSPAQARQALAALGDGPVEEAAAGFLAVANAAMAAAIAELSTSRGHDPADHVLLPFGGAAGQHACAVADRLGIRSILVHPHAGVLSALGIARAPRVATRSLAVEEPWSEALAARRDELSAPLADDARAELARAGVTAERVRVRWRLRYAGSDTTLGSDGPADFAQQHRRLFGFLRPEVPIEVASLEVELRSGMPTVDRPAAVADRPTPPPLDHRRIGFPGPLGDLSWHHAPVHRLRDLGPGVTVEGPALVAADTTTLVVDPGWRARIESDEALSLERTSPLSAARLTTERSAARMELYHRRFMSLATRMGERLRRVAWSVNIKERLDFSCALFDAEGHLVANAPHIPVHLGAMGETVRALAARLGDAVRPGCTWAVNDPRSGGSHLPDITVITPVFAGGRRVAWVANRGHHADVGGRTPGSMPPDSRDLAEEGVVLRDLLLVDGGRWLAASVVEALTEGGGRWPARQPDVNVADLQAQVASNALGAELLSALVARDGVAVVAAWMGHIQDNAADVAQRWIAGLGPAARRFEDALDDGTPVVVRLQRTGEAGARRLSVDFAGTGPRSPSNLNAPPAVVRAALLYVMRCAFGRAVPLNEGCLRHVDLRLPDGSLFDPGPHSAVVGGNVETSQRVVDVLLGALGLAAASQGTMNNLTFGTRAGAYYETVCGGAGATDGSAGGHAIQTHMTNTRITDPEILELRFPVQVRRFALRRGSGGVGRNRGGDGVVRALRFLESADVALLSQRRTVCPFGLNGGGPGAAGQAVLRRGGLVEQLPGRFNRRVEPGDEIELRTPGGGGFGAPDLADL